MCLNDHHQMMMEILLLNYILIEFTKFSQGYSYKDRCFSNNLGTYMRKKSFQCFLLKKTGSPLARSTVVTAIKFTIVDQPAPIDLLLNDCIGKTHSFSSFVASVIECICEEMQF